MKLKSLLLGSAAVLALSTGAQAADPVVEFVSLGVCDALGMSGLTIESDDTCLLISGGVQYDYTVENFSFGASDVADTESDLNWDLAFEAQTQTDDGVAVAYISFDEDGTDDINVNEAYAQFILSNGTALSAGLRDSIFDTEIFDDTYGNDKHDWFDFEIDNEEAFGEEFAATTGGHGIQLEAVVADGFTVLASLEDLEGDGTAGLGVAYDASGISAEAGVLFGNLYSNADPLGSTDQQVNYYGKVSAEFDNFAARAGFIADDDGNWVANVGADATFDMFSLKADALFNDDEDFAIMGEGSFDATETVAVYLGAGYEELASVEIFTVYGGVDVDVTETITAFAELGYTDPEGLDDYVYGAGGVTYAPGGNFETSLEGFVASNENYQVVFSMEKTF
ncbi:porin [Pelagibacterium sp. 26DY04]|uniref:hypothetical protein n=1 Tax=Pelagibacterium sp. 26DY04 TaxID=2967130 RepID=UPI00281548FB|nr:hypothetical protein [Pelagibacterium sp. 26DY04]WMT88517.1 porin [Pelagibacterium sp. 26DY04]